MINETVFQQHKEATKQKSIKKACHGPLCFEKDILEENFDAILKERLPVEDDKITSELKDKEVSITIPEEILRADGLQIMKHFIQMDIFKFVNTLEKISFVETHVNKQIATKKPEAKEKTA